MVGSGFWRSPATAPAEGGQFNGPPFPATAWAEGPQLNAAPSLRFAVRGVHCKAIEALWVFTEDLALELV